MVSRTQAQSKNVYVSITASTMLQCGHALRAGCCAVRCSGAEIRARRCRTRLPHTLDRERLMAGILVLTGRCWFLLITLCFYL